MRPNARIHSTALTTSSTNLLGVAEDHHRAVHLGEFIVEPRALVDDTWRATVRSDTTPATAQAVTSPDVDIAAGRADCDCSDRAERGKRVPAALENGPAIADQDGFKLWKLVANALYRGDCLCPVRELGVGQQVQSAPRVSAHEVTRDERRPFQDKCEFAGGLASVHLEHAQTGYGLIPIAEPALARKGEVIAFPARPAQRSAKLLREALCATRVVGVRDDDEHGATQRREMRAIMLAHWQRVDEDVAFGSDPGHAAKVDVAALVEARPTMKVRTVQ